MLSGRRKSMVSWVVFNTFPSRGLIADIFRNLRSTVQAKQGGCLLELPSVGVRWLCHCLRLFHNSVRPDEAVRLVLRACPGHSRMDHR